MHAYADTQTQRAPLAAPRAIRRRASGVRRPPAEDATGRLARALDARPAVAATQRLQRSLVGGAATPARVQRHTGPAIIQRVNDRFDREELEKIHAIARRAGVDPTKIRFRKSGWDYSQTIDDLIKLNPSMLDDEREFILGHELSHYKTHDNRNFPFSTMGLTTLAAAALGTAVGGPWPALLAGGLGFAGEYLAGGGLFNALAHGAGSAALVGLGPLGAWIGSSLTEGAALGSLMGGTLGTLGGALAGLFPVSKLFEIKADLHAAAMFGTQGGINRFEKQMKKRMHRGAIGMTDGNEMWDRQHPPLSMRVAYLKLLNRVLGI